MNNEFYAFMRDSRFGKMLVLVLAIFAAFLAVQIVNAVKANRYIGGGVPSANVISVNGVGEVFAVPDVATFTVTVMEEKMNATDAQKAATDKINAIVAYLKESGIEDKDVKTVAYNVSPHYEYIQDACVSGVCRPGRQELRGFQASQTLSVKVRDTKKAGELLAGVGTKGANQVSGLDFTIDDQDKLEADARAKAIDDARTKANELAKQLGVRIVRVVSFSEATGGMPSPYYAYGMGGKVALDSAAANPPQVPTGENQITSSVSITYEIR